MAKLAPDTGDIREQPAYIGRTKVGTVDKGRSGGVRAATHFAGFRGDEYGRACRVFGRPDFIHRGWDKRARREIDFDRDLILFATGEHDQPFSARNFDDIREVVS